jgi:hypothetical protein
VLAAAAPAIAASDDDADGPFHSLDSVDTGEMHSLDSVDTGQTETLDSVDAGQTETLDSVDAGQTESLDAVEQRADESPPAAPAPRALPAIQDGNWEAQAREAKGIIVAAEGRLREANKAYGNMMQRDYPRGEARAKIIAERDTAESSLNEAWAYYGEIKSRASNDGNPL